MCYYLFQEELKGKHSLILLLYCLWNKELIVGLFSTIFNKKNNWKFRCFVVLICMFVILHLAGPVEHSKLLIIFLHEYEILRNSTQKYKKKTQTPYYNEYVYW